MRRLFTVIAASSLVAAPLMLSASSQAVTPMCFGQPATVVGTAGPDSLGGGPTDVVYGGGGDDDLGGYIVCGGPGADYIIGQPYTDNKLSGGGGDDRIDAWFGVDTLWGGGGNDRIDDTDDFDWPDYYDPGTDIMRGGAGDDEINSTCGPDKVYGGAGNDTINDWTRAKSYLYGGGGNDTIDATRNEAGTNPLRPDYVSGDLGYDVAIANWNDIVTSSTEKIIRP
jgi:Ca2+-binding RTX toxin-like protein